MAAYERVKAVLADGEWHSLEELKQVSSFPERWLEELRRDGLLMEDRQGGKVALNRSGTDPNAYAPSYAAWE
jgi:hypothetical protein